MQIREDNTKGQEECSAEQKKECAEYKTQRRKSTLAIFQVVPTHTYTHTHAGFKAGAGQFGSLCLLPPHHRRFWACASVLTSKPETKTLHINRAKQQPLTPDSCYTHTHSEQGQVQLAQGYGGQSVRLGCKVYGRTLRYQLRNLQTQFRVEGKRVGGVVVVVGVRRGVSIPRGPERFAREEARRSGPKSEA